MKGMLFALILLGRANLSAASEEIFNGKDLDGWRFIASERNAVSFSVQDGKLRTGGKGILWYSKEKIGNATLRVVYSMSNGKGNSGVFIRIPEVPETESDAINKGIEVQIDDRDDDWHCTGVLYSMTKALARPSKPAPEWNTLEIQMNGPRTIVKLNGVLVTDYDGLSPVPWKLKPWEPDRHPRPDSGYIALQSHDSNAVISFGEISVTPTRTIPATR